MAEGGGNQIGGGEGSAPRMFFRKYDGMAKSLLEMGSIKGLYNLGFERELTKEEIEIEIDYNSIPDEEEFSEEEPSPLPEKDSGRGSREEAEVNDRISVVSSARTPRVVDYLSDESVGHFRPGSSTSDDSLMDSNFDDGGRPLTPEESTLEKRIEEWNVFATAPHIDSNESKELCFALARKIMKVLTYIVMFPCMLALIILSKGSILIAVANVRPYPRSGSSSLTTSGNTVFAFNDATTTDQGSTSSEFFDLRCRMFVDNRTTPVTTSNGTYEGSEHFDYVKCVAVPYGYKNASRLDDLSCLNPANHSGYLNASEAYSRDECFVVRNYWAWSVLLMICTPYVFVFLRCFWRILFKKKKSPTWKAILATLLIEALHTIGICIMFFVVMPSLDNSILALMFLLGVATIPGALKILVRPEDEKRRLVKLVLDCLATIGQISILVLWPFVVAVVRDKDYDTNLIWSIPVSLLLVSVRWWENFVEKNSRLGKIRKYLNRFSGQMRRSRTKIQLLGSLWKILVAFVTMTFCMTTQVEYMDPLDLFQKKFTAIFNFSLR